MGKFFKIVVDNEKNSWVFCVFPPCFEFNTQIMGIIVYGCKFGLSFRVQKYYTKRALYLIMLFKPILEVIGMRYPRRVNNSFPTYNSETKT